MLMLDKNLEKLLIPAAVTVVATAFFLILRAVIFRFLEPWSRRTVSKIDDTIVAVLRTPSYFWCAAFGLYVGLAVSELPYRISLPLFIVVHVALVLSTSIVISNIAVAGYRHLMETSDQATGTSGLAVGLLRAFINGIGLLVIFGIVGIDIKPMLTALGVGGIAVALALKDTLENLFAGVYLITDRTIRVGDYIKLETGHEGMIEDIGWRTTRIFLTSNSTVILPNSKIAQSVVTNYSLPENRVLLTVRISVALSNEVDQVESLISKSIDECADKVPGLLMEPRPVVRLSSTPSDYMLDFNAYVYVAHFSQQGIVGHELRKAIYKKFDEAGIKRPSLYAPPS